MANSFGLLLLAITILFCIGLARKDAKFFGKYMVILLLSLCVGAGVRAAMNKIKTVNTLITTTINTEVLGSTQAVSPFVSENTMSCLEPASKNITRSDNSVFIVSKLPTNTAISEFIDDS